MKLKIHMSTDLPYVFWNTSPYSRNQQRGFTSLWLLFDGFGRLVVSQDPLLFDLALEGGQCLLDDETFNSLGDSIAEGGALTLYMILRTCDLDSLLSGRRKVVSRHGVVVAEDKVDLQRLCVMAKETCIDFLVNLLSRTNLLVNIIDLSHFVLLDSSRPTHIYTYHIEIFWALSAEGDPFSRAISSGVTATSHDFCTFKWSDGSAEPGLLHCRFAGRVALPFLGELYQPRSPKLRCADHFAGLQV